MLSKAKALRSVGTLRQIKMGVYEKRCKWRKHTNIYRFSPTSIIISMDKKYIDKSFYNKVVSSGNRHSQEKVYLRDLMKTLKHKLSEAKRSTCIEARFSA